MLITYEGIQQNRIDDEIIYIIVNIYVFVGVNVQDGTNKGSDRSIEVSDGSVTYTTLL